jgi:hypothetical protein
MAETDRDPEKLADKLEQETNELEDRSKKLEGEISDVRGDWESKRRAPGVPGALPPDDEQREDPGEDEESGADKD